MNKEYKDLTKNSQYLLTQMLKKYHLQIKYGKAKHQAIYINRTAWDTKKDFMSSYDLEDVNTFLNELQHNGFINCNYGSNFAVDITLSNKSLEWYDHRFRDNFNEFLDLANKIKNLIPKLPNP